MPRTALYTGSFDPLTNGHLDVIRHACRLVDRFGAGGTPPGGRTVEGGRAGEQLAPTVRQVAPDQYLAGIAVAAPGDHYRDERYIAQSYLRADPEIGFEAGLCHR